MTKTAQVHSDVDLVQDGPVVKPNLIGFLDATYNLTTRAWANRFTYGDVQQAARFVPRVLDDARRHMAEVPSAELHVGCAFYVPQDSPRLLEGFRKIGEPIQAWLALAAFTPPSPLELGDFAAFRLVIFLTSPTKGEENVDSLISHPELPPAGTLQTLRYLKAEAADVQKPIIDRFRTWFKTVEGKSFESYEEAEEAINIIKYFTRLAELQIFYKDKPVSLQCTRSPRSRRATIQIRTHRKGSRKNLYHGTSMPPLELHPPS